MHKPSLALIALTVGLFSASQAKASTDTFTLTGDGNTFSFSLTPSNATPCGIGAVCYLNVPVTANTTHSQTDTIEFTANDGLEIFASSNPNKIVTLGLDTFVPFTFTPQSDFYSDTISMGTASVSFDPGTYYLFGYDNGHGNYGGGYDLNPNQSYTLTITDPPPAVPEPSSLALMSTGLLAAAGAVRRRMKK